MPLSICIKKGHDSKSSITVTRQDGTNTYSKLPVNFEIHDIAHFVVEKQIGFKKSFYGLLAEGYQIDQFQLPKEERPSALWPKNIPKEALITEHLVNLLTIDFMGSETKMDILESLKIILQDNSLPFPESLDYLKLNSIQNELSDLMQKWNTLEGGEVLKMELEF